MEQQDLMQDVGMDRFHEAILSGVFERGRYYVLGRGGKPVTWNSIAHLYSSEERAKERLGTLGEGVEAIATDDLPATVSEILAGDEPVDLWLDETWHVEAGICRASDYRKVTHLRIGNECSVYEMTACGGQTVPRWRWHPRYRQTGYPEELCRPVARYHTLAGDERVCRREAFRYVPMLEHAFYATLAVQDDGTPVERIYAEPKFDLGFIELPVEQRVFMEEEGVFLLMAERTDGREWQVATWVPRDMVTGTMLTAAVAGEVKSCLFDNGPVRMANRCFAQMQFALRTPDLTQRKQRIAEALTTARRVHAKHPEIRMLQEMVRAMTTDDESMVAAAVCADHAAWHTREGRNADAWRMANLSVEADDRYSFGHYNRAFVIHGKSGAKTAMPEYQRVLELQPHHGPTWGNVCYTGSTDLVGMPDATRTEAWRRAVELDRQDVCCLAFLADDSSLDAEAHVAYLKSIIERDPGNREARHNLVVAYMQTNAAEAACEAAAEFVTSCCGCEDAYVDLILTAYRMERWETVVQAFELWERTATDSWPQRHWLARAIGIKRFAVENRPSKWMCRVVDCR